MTTPTDTADNGPANLNKESIAAEMLHMAEEVAILSTRLQFLQAQLLTQIARDNFRRKLP